MHVALIANQLIVPVITNEGECHIVADLFFNECQQIAAASFHGPGTTAALQCGYTMCGMTGVYNNLAFDGFMGHAWAITFFTYTGMSTA